MVSRDITYVVLWIFVFTVPSSSMLVLSAGFGTLSRAVGLAAVPFAAAAVLLSGRRHRLLDVHVLILVLTAWAVLSSLWTITPTSTRIAVATILQLAILVLLIWEFAPGDRWRRLLWAYVLGAWTVAGQLIFVALQGAAVYRGRFTTAGFNPNDLAKILLLGVGLAWYVGLKSRTTVARLVAWAFVPVGVVGTILTGSRTGALLVPLALLVIPLSLDRKERGRASTTLASLLIITGLAAAVVPESTFTRVTAVADDLQSGALSGRQALWAAAIDTVERNPVGGVGAGGLRRTIQQDTGQDLGAHNGFLTVAGELGLPGLAVFLLILAAALARGLRLGRAERALAVTTLVVLVGGLLTSHAVYAKPTWLVLAFALGPVQQRETTTVNRLRLMAPQLS